MNIVDHARRGEQGVEKYVLFSMKPREKKQKSTHFTKIQGDLILSCTLFGIRAIYPLFSMPPTSVEEPIVDVIT